MIPDWILKDDDLTLTERLVYSMLLSFWRTKGDKPTVQITDGRISDYLNISVRAVEEAKRRLGEHGTKDRPGLGYVKWIDNKFKVATEYTYVLDKRSTENVERSAENVERSTKNVDKRSTKNVDNYNIYNNNTINKAYSTKGTYSDNDIEEIINEDNDNSTNGTSTMEKPETRLHDFISIIERNNVPKEKVIGSSAFALNNYLHTSNTRAKTELESNRFDSQEINLMISKLNKLYEYPQQSVS